MTLFQPWKKLLWYTQKRAWSLYYVLKRLATDQRKCKVWNILGPSAVSTNTYSTTEKQHKSIVFKYVVYQKEKLKKLHKEGTIFFCIVINDFNNTITIQILLSTPHGGFSETIIIIIIEIIKKCSKIVDKQFF